MRIITFLCCCLPFVATLAQQKYTISGYISDARNNEQLIGANVYDVRTLTGTTTNEYGFFSLTLPADSIQLVVSFVGYQSSSETFVLTADTIKNISFPQCTIRGSRNIRH